MFQIKVVEKIKPHILYLITFFENRAVYEIMWKNMVTPVRWQYGTCALHAGYLWLQKHVIITAFTLQQWLGGNASMLRDTYIA